MNPISNRNFEAMNILLSEISPLRSSRDIYLKEPAKYSQSKMKPVLLQVCQVDQYEHSFGHNSLDLKRIITKFGQMNLLVKNFRMQTWLLRKSSCHSKKHRNI